MVATPVNTNCSARKSRETSKSPKDPDTDNSESSTDQNDNLKVKTTNLKRSLSANASINRRKVGLRTFTIGLDKTQNERQNVIIFLFLSIPFTICSGYSEEPSHGDGSSEYPQHMF